jgi:outer membrane lipoprotein-sorting protein
MQSRRRHNPRGLTMQRWSATLAISLLLAFQAPNLGAQDTTASGPALTNKQIELVRKVTAYFNQLTSLKGTFIQTGPDNKRQRGKFYISRPGRFRFEFNLPSKVVIISDGKYIAIQDHDLNTDDRWDLSYTPFRSLLQKDVDLLRDTRVLEAQVVDNTIVISFEDRGGDASNRIKLFLAATPEVQIKGWIVKDAQGLETRVDLMEISGAGELDAKLFDPAM